MRKKFVYFVLIPALLFLLLVYVFIDSWVESGLEYAGERIAEAKVEIDDLHLSLSPLGIEFRRCQVANRRDPWKNVFETGRVAFAMDLGQLVRGKIIIETMEINDVILGTQRTTDGSLPPPPPPSSEPPGALTGLATDMTNAVGARLAEAPVFDLEQLRRQLNIDSLLNVKNLKTVQHIDSVKRLATTVKSQWNQGLAEVTQAKVRVAEIEKQLKAIKPNELKTVESITSAVTSVNDATAAITSLNQTFNTRRQALTTDIQALSGAVAGVNAAFEQDYEMVRGLARIPSISMAGMASLLIGTEMYADVLEYVSWIEFVRDKIPVVKSKPDIEAPPRMRGQNIRFPVERGYPSFWIKNIVLSGGTDSSAASEYYYVRGTVQHVTNDQRITGSALTASLSATRGGALTVDIGATIDRTGDLPVDDYKAQARGFAIRGMRLGKADFLPSTITRASTAIDVRVHVPGQAFDASATVDFADIALAFDRDAHTLVERLTRDVLSSVRAFSTTLKVWKREGRLDIALQTDLDDRLVAEAQRVVGAEIARLQKDLRAKLDERISAKRAELQTIIAQNLASGRQEVQSLEGLMTQNLSLAESKKRELEARIEEEKKKQTDAAKKKLDDAVKGLFKKQ